MKEEVIAKQIAINQEETIKRELLVGYMEENAKKTKDKKEVALIQTKIEGMKKEIAFNNNYVAFLKRQ